MRIDYATGEPLAIDPQAARTPSQLLAGIHKRAGRTDEALRRARRVRPRGAELDRLHQGAHGSPPAARPVRRGGGRRAPVDRRRPRSSNGYFSSAPRAGEPGRAPRRGRGWGAAPALVAGCRRRSGRSGSRLETAQASTRSPGASSGRRRWPTRRIDWSRPTRATIATRPPRCSSSTWIASWGASSAPRRARSTSSGGSRSGRRTWAAGASLVRTHAPRAAPPGRGVPGQEADGGRVARRPRRLDRVDPPDPPARRAHALGRGRRHGGAHAGGGQGRAPLDAARAAAPRARPFTRRSCPWVPTSAARCCSAATSTGRSPSCGGPPVTVTRW